MEAVRVAMGVAVAGRRAINVAACQAVRGHGGCCAGGEECDGRCVAKPLEGLYGLGGVVTGAEGGGSGI